jgi:hypothetical protein
VKDITSCTSLTNTEFITAREENGQTRKNDGIAIKGRNNMEER